MALAAEQLLTDEERAALVALRRDLHATPELAFEEFDTARKVAATLRDAGLEVQEGIAGTGVKAVLRGASPGRTMLIRADMDALPVQETSGRSYGSRTAGKMHACGHDGHTTMLLGAARYLAESKPFDGTVYFIFQPAEENEGGGRAMVQDGLFDRFPMESVYGMHNVPGIPAGTFGIRPGPIMASFDVFEIRIVGHGAHAALPHTGIDPIVAGSQLVQALQSIVSRNVDPLDSGVITVTQFHAGDTWNVIPEEVVLRGTTRAFRPPTQDLIERRLRETAEGVARLSGTRIDVRYERRYPPTINSAEETEHCRQVAEQLVGPQGVAYPVEPLMAAEDFAFMLQAKPGCYVFIGNGPGESGCMLHNPRYDFNDRILPMGSSYWVRLVEHLLPRR